MSIKGFEVGGVQERYDYTALDNTPANLVQDANYVHTDNNFTNTDKTKLDGIATGANKTIIDATLTQSGQAADAKAAGDEINDLKSAFTANLIHDTATGSIASFPDGAARPVDDLTVKIEPVQDLHGYDNPWPAGGGKNKLPNENGTYKGTTGNNINIVESESPVLLPAGTYYIKYFADKSTGLALAGFYLSINGGTASRIGSNHATQEAVESFVLAEQSNITLRLYSSTNGFNEAKYRFMLTVEDSTNIAFSPYSNICPISGWAGAKVTRTGKNLIDMSDITDYSKWSADIAPSGDMPSATNNRIYSLPALKSGVQYTISFGVTSASFPKFLYFGYYKDNSAKKIVYVTTDYINNQSIPFTAIAGVTYCLCMGTTYNEDAFKAQIAKLSYIQLELGSTATAYEPYQGNTYDITFPSEAGTVYGGTLDVTTGVLTVDRAQIASYAGETLPSTWISDRDVYSAGATPTTGAQVVYELATPVTYQLTPQEITTLLGQNNIWADTGDVSVKYNADTKLYIDNKITQAIAAALNS